MTTTQLQIDALASMPRVYDFVNDAIDALIIERQSGSVSKHVLMALVKLQSLQLEIERFSR